MEKSKYNLINTQEELSSFLTDLTSSSVFYWDFEFDKNHFRYGFNLCLIQINLNDKNYIIDPFKFTDLSALWKIFENEKITKVGYALGEDIRLLQHLGYMPKNIFDIALAYNLLGEKTLSLTNILKSVLDIDLPQSQQKSNWFDRPLTEKQLNYAAEDVIFLPMLYKAVQKELINADRLLWMEEEIAFQNSVVYPKNETYNKPQNKFKKQISKKAWYILNGLFEVRDELARQINRPAYKVVNDQILVSIAENENTIDTWTTIKGVHPKIKTKQVAHKINNAIIEHVQKYESKILLSAEENILGIKENKHKRTKSIYYEEQAKSILKPIKDEIAKDYGIEFANFMLSNRKMVGIISLQTPLLNYQKNIIGHYAKELDITLPEF